ncbi:MAG: 50S ribosomal protein L9 [Spirochaeta sp. LUC14_002_19_P3]|nr:MAG: 50S ribosomal protein L9 [Spirochaeta sp. LUC14_002_19_P3]
MKIILYSDIPNLGEEGEIKDVADGYARNYLLPRKFAVRYTKAAVNELEQKQRAISRRKEEKITAAADDKTKIESIEMDIEVAAGEKGKLFGSVTSGTIMEFLDTRGIAVERKHIELPENGIKIVGTHTVTIKLYGGERAVLKVNVSALGDHNKAAGSMEPSESSIPVQPDDTEPVTMKPSESSVQPDDTEPVTEEPLSDSITEG